MAHLEDKIAEIKDTQLRQTIAAEVRELKNLITEKRRFGLVFESHQPEVVPIYSKTVRVGLHVVKKTGTLSETWRVARVHDGIADLVKDADDSRETAPLESLVVVRRMGEPIYPALVPMGNITNADPTHPHHILIEADNYHALQLLEYVHRGKVDCIYIDPPYNTGARDWKYNNDYVDKNDGWRHSKWLAMMQKRLALAKRLLRDDGVLIVTIDDYEIAHLDCLLEEIFPGFARYIVTIEHNKRGRRGKNFAKSNEFAIFVLRDGTEPVCEELLDGLGGEVRNLRRTGSGSLRHQRHKKFYPIYANVQTKEILEIGDPIPLDDEFFSHAPKEITSKYPGQTITIIWPIDEDGREKNWHYASPRAKAEAESGKLMLREQSYGWQVYYSLREKDSKKFKTVWTGSHLDASTHGTELLEKILGTGQAFDFPKSVYAVRQCLLTVIMDRPNALIVDFFAGSGTTLNAVNLLNAVDGGHRQCILVTNNEVSEADAQSLQSRGLQPGDEEWEANGICQHVTWPRSKYTINGKRDDGTPLPGEYLTGRTITKEKARAVRQLGFSEGRNLSLRQRQQMAALIDPIPQSKIKGDEPWFLDDEIPASILWDVTRAEDWLIAISEAEHVTDFYVVTQENKLFKQIKANIADVLPPISYEEEEKRPLADGFAASLTYLKLDFLDPHELQLGRQFSAVLPVLWMMAGAKGTCPEPPSSHSPWLIPDSCPFAVLLQETRFKDFHRHIEKRSDLTHVFVVTNAQEVYYKLREEIDAPHVIQLYKDYLENFKINLKQD